MPPPQRVRMDVSYDLGSQGRMSNSLLQAAATIGLARKHGVQPCFQSSWCYREWFSFPDEMFRDDLTGTIPAQTLARDLPPAMRPYLQDLRLWAHAADEVRACWQPSPKARAILDNRWSRLTQFPGPYCALHVRRGDTVTRNPPNTIQPLPASYFTDAVRHAVANWQSRTVFVFSDDPAWCRENLPPEWPIVEAEPGPEDTEIDYLTRPRRDWIDLFLMARIAESGSIVISNSSYSLVSAWLGGNDHVIAPARWFGARLRAKQFDENLIIPSDWTRLEVTEDE